jgi:hypothetical protein
MHTRNMQFLLLFHGNNSYAKALLCYLICTLPLLLCLMAILIKRKSLFFYEHMFLYNNCSPSMSLQCTPVLWIIQTQRLHSVFIIRVLLWIWSVLLQWAVCRIACVVRILTRSQLPVKRIPGNVYIWSTFTVHWTIHYSDQYVFVLIALKP